MRSTHPSEHSLGKNYSDALFQLVFCLLKAGFLLSDKHLYSTNWAHIISTQPPSLWLQNTCSEQHRLFTNCTIQLCISPFPTKGLKISAYLYSMGIFFCSAQFENQEGWQNKFHVAVCAHFSYKTHFSTYAHKPMDTKQTQHSTWKPKRAECSLTDRHTDAVVYTYNDRSALLGLPRQADTQPLIIPLFQTSLPTAFSAELA